MWKILLVAVTVTLTQARPSYLHDSFHGSYLPPTYEHIEYEPTLLGHELHSIPTAVSHQSQTIVHEKRPYLRPIVEHAPIYKSYNAPSAVVGWPEYSTYSPYSPLSYSGLYDHGWTPSYGTPVYSGWNGWPLK